MTDNTARQAAIEAAEKFEHAPTFAGLEHLTYRQAYFSSGYLAGIAAAEAERDDLKRRLEWRAKNLTTRDSDGDVINWPGVEDRWYRHWDEERVKREAAEARAETAERERDELQQKNQGIIDTAINLIGRFCEKHSAEVREMPFPEFAARIAGKCEWCTEENLALARADCAALREALRNFEVATDLIDWWVNTIWPRSRRCGRR